MYISNSHLTSQRWLTHLLFFAIYYINRVWFSGFVALIFIQYHVLHWKMPHFRKCVSVRRTCSYDYCSIYYWKSMVLSSLRCIAMSKKSGQRSKSEAHFRFASDRCRDAFLLMPTLVFCLRYCRSWLNRKINQTWSTICAAALAIRIVMYVWMSSSFNASRVSL